jgi:hypothetical protein
MKNIHQILFTIKNFPGREQIQPSVTPKWAGDCSELFHFTQDAKGLLEESARFNLAFEHLIESLVIVWSGVLDLSCEEERILGDYLSKTLAPLKTSLRKRREVLYQYAQRREAVLQHRRARRFQQEAIHPTKPAFYIDGGELEPLSENGLWEEFCHSWTED